MHCVAFLIVIYKSQVIFTNLKNEASTGKCYEELFFILVFNFTAAYV